MSKESSVRCKNKNTLFITSRDLTYDGIEDYLHDLIDLVCERTNLLKSNFEINNPRYNGEPSNHCFVWINSQEIVNVIIGLNPDGSKDEHCPLIEIPDYENGPIHISRSEVILRDNISSDTLFCAKVPNGVTSRDIAEEFQKYSVSQEDFKVRVSIKSIKSGVKICTVSFKPSSTDGIFAQQMRMFCRINGQVLVFKPSQRN